MLTKFTPDVCKRLEYYVYRLIDPRTGQTFYVGKGKNNRVFAHAQDALKDYDGVDYLNAEQDDEISAKIQQIRDIHNAGLEVIMVIHRWGMDEATAYEVESALTDCYPGLTNEQSGHDSDRGVANVDRHKYILVSLYGEVIAIYKNAKWFKSPTEPGRWEFEAEEANKQEDAQIIERYLHKSLPERYVKKGMARPTLYQS